MGLAPSQARKGTLQSCSSLKLGRCGCDRRALPPVPKGRMMDSLRPLRGTTWGPRGQEPSHTLLAKGIPEVWTHVDMQGKAVSMPQHKHCSLCPHTPGPGLPEGGSRLPHGQERGL